MDIGNKIKEFREYKGYTQQELADKIAVSKSSIQKYENGDISVSLNILDRIADALGKHIVNFIAEDADDILLLVKERFNLKDNNHGQLEYDFNILMEVLKIKYQKK